MRIEVRNSVLAFTQDITLSQLTAISSETNLPETMDVRDNDAAPSTSGSDGASSADAENLAAAAAEVAAAHDDVENDASQANADFDQPHDSADFAAQELSEAFMHVDESYEVEQSKTVVKPRFVYYPLVQDF